MISKDEKQLEEILMSHPPLPVYFHGFARRLLGYVSVSALMILLIPTGALPAFADELASSGAASGPTDPQEPSDNQTGSDDQSGSDEVPALGEITALDEITVSASYSLNRQTPVETMALSRQEILEMPTFGGDLFRAISLVPGISGNDVSSAFSVRGAPYAEVLVRLDGVELFEPFHLKDYSGVLSIVDPQVVDGLEIYPGSFPAMYGDRQAAVVDLTTRSPFSTETRAGASLSSVYLTRGQRFGDEDQGSGLLSLRRGWLDIVFNLVGNDEEGEEEEGAPEYSDLYGKMDWSLSEQTDVGVWGLWADDSLDSKETEDDGVLEAINSSYGNLWLVGRGQHLPNNSTVMSGRLFAGQVDRDRLASEEEGQTDFVVDDKRTLDVLGLAAETSLDLRSRHLLNAGLEARTYTADYDYRLERNFRDPISGVSNLEDQERFDQEIDGDSLSLWLSDRWRINDRLVAELGVRYDRQQYDGSDRAKTSDDQISPRLSLIYDIGNGGILRGGWGHAYQSRRPNELAVEDGDLEFPTAEKAEHRTLGYEQVFDGGLRLRLDAYQRLGTELGPRYVNLFNPSVLFPEGSPDRVRLDPDRYDATGIELFLQGKKRSRFNWWLSYTWSQVEDRVNGEWIPRSTDQTHALTVDVGYRFGRWNLNAAWIYHTGWPITELTARLDADGNVQPVVDTFFGDRVDDYHRLDVRLSRDFALSGGNRNLQLYFDVQNLYNRENVRGFEFGEQAFQVQPDGSVNVVPETDTWLGTVPSFGVTLSF